MDQFLPVKFEVMSHGWDDVDSSSQNAGRGDDNLTQKTPFSSLQRSEARTDSGSDLYSDCWINSLMENLIGLPVRLLVFSNQKCENCLYLCIILFAQG